VNLASSPGKDINAFGVAESSQLKSVGNQRKRELSHSIIIPKKKDFR